MKFIISAVVGAAFLLLGVFPVVFGSWYTVDQGERGVILRNGAVSGVAQPGLGFKTPWIETVQKVNVHTQTRTWENMSTYSKDQQPAFLKVSVTYHPVATRVADIYSNYGGVDGVVTKLLDPHVPQMVKVVFGGYTAVSAVQDRGKLNADIATAISESVDVGGLLVVDSVQLENIDFSKGYEKSIEMRMEAEVEVQRLRQTEQQQQVQARIVVIKAEAEAAAVEARAKAQAQATRIQGEAEADAIKARAAALGSNPALVQLTQAEKWDGRLPTTMVPGGAVPMLSLQGQAR